MKKELGQFMTINEILQEKVISFIKNNPQKILEPSAGQGHLIQKLLQKKPKISYDAYEIDNELDFLIDNIKICDFLLEPINQKYKTIIGNPPFVRTKTGNLYQEFIRKCFNLLLPNGELIFIVPSSFFKLTSSSHLLTEMYEKGCFTHIYYPNQENLFKGASIDILIFRYCLKPSKNKKCIFNDETRLSCLTNGIISFNLENIQGIKIGDYFNCYVGMVSGLEEVFKNEIGNIDIQTDFNKIEKYILIHEFPSDNEEINNHLLENQSLLLNRRIRKFNDDNWFQWGALRNYKTILDNLGKPCIYVKNLTRSDVIAEVGEVRLFSAKMLILIPKVEINLEEYCDKINNFRNEHLYSGRFKIGHKELLNKFL